MDCIDLKARFGERFRVRYEEAYRHQYGDGARVVDPWYMEVVCQHGCVYPHGGRRLAASTNSSGPVAKRLRAMPGVEVRQDGSDGVTVLFDVDLFEVVAEVIKPRRRRVLSESARRQLAEAGKKTQFKHGVQNAGEALVCVGSTQDDSQHLPEQTGAQNIVPERATR